MFSACSSILNALNAEVLYVYVAISGNFKTSNKLGVRISDYYV